MGANGVNFIGQGIMDRSGGLLCLPGMAAYAGMSGQVWLAGLCDQSCVRFLLLGFLRFALMADGTGLKVLLVDLDTVVAD